MSCRWGQTKWHTPQKFKFYIITARKRSFGQRNVFTHVCHSVHRGEGVSVWCNFLSGWLVPCSYVSHFAFSISFVSRSRRVSASGPMFHPGGPCPGDGICQWDFPWTKIPLYSDERAVRILLECFLVRYVSLDIVNKFPWNCFRELRSFPKFPTKELVSIRLETSHCTWKGAMNSITCRILHSALVLSVDHLRSQSSPLYYGNGSRFRCWGDHW